MRVSAVPTQLSPLKVRGKLKTLQHPTTPPILTFVLLCNTDSEEPTKPELKILAIDLIGVIYTLKLARHYFSKNPLNDESHDRCFIVNASLVGFLDVPGILQYMASKWGCRALMRCVRRTTVIDGVRMNLTGPW